MSLSSGTRLGPFQIVERVDLPGFGEVYAARDDENDRDVAIHVLRTNAAQDEDVRDRFEQHVRAAAARVQPDPLTIHLVGVDPQAIYVVSEPIHPAAAPLVPGVQPAFGPALGAAFGTAVRRDVPAPKRGWVIAAAVAVVAIAIGMFAVGGGEDAPEEAALAAQSAPPDTPVVPAIPAPPPVPERELLPPEQTEIRDYVATDPSPRPRAAMTSAPASEAEPAPPEPVMRRAPAASPAASPVPPSSPAPVRRPLPVTDSRDTTTLITEATVHATEFDLEGALSLLEAAAGRGDAFARLAVLYVRGLIGAREAFRDGGDPSALAPVHASLTTLGEISGGRPGAAEIARLVLQAASAAAQSERDEMRLYIDSAIQMESLQLAAMQGGAPIVSASELAGDFWLQVSRYDEARRAYTEAAERVGFTLRILSGLARSARRLNDMPAACTAYRRLADVWGARPGLPVEIAEARAYLGGCPR